MEYSIRLATIDDYDALYELWNSTEQSRRAIHLEPTLIIVTKV
jgi:hypothetical protein